MKKILAFLLVTIMVFSLVACGGKDNPQPSGNEKEPGSSQQTQQPSDTPDEGEDDNGGQTAGWPTEGYGALIPEPDWDYEIFQDDEFRFIAIHENVSFDDLKAYTEKLKEAGFNTNVTERGEGETWYWKAATDALDMSMQVEDGRILVEPY